MWFATTDRNWVYLRLRLARACAYLRWLAMTCAHFGRDQICTQVKATFSPFSHPTQVSSSWVTSMNLLLAKEIEDSLLKNIFFVTCEYLRGNLRFCLATQRKSFRKFNLRPLATTCRSVWPGLKRLSSIDEELDGVVSRRFCKLRKAGEWN